MYSLSFMGNRLTRVLNECNNNSTRVGIHNRVFQCSNLGMNTPAMRISKLRKIIDDDFGGSQSSFSAFTEIKPQQVSRWLSKKAAKIPEISEASARDIEKKCRKPAGWMDVESPMPILSSQALKLAEIISSLPEPQQSALIHLVESALEMQRQAQLLPQPASTDGRLGT